ncbi:hypothetical protein IWW39_000623 [Coemansia spiralis]|uniref:Arrestin C-terminal-like domain-containing protein n=1 Tax=Coemansia spiralis TaxID=417178 RepID=A0A9W8GNW0_9FUNG|nr:hypothetical protein IWW39_000623 [Coemansia spiralis]
MRSGPSLEIVLDQPELLVRGTLDEATPAVLSGRLIVHLGESIRVRSLKLVFTGRIDTFFSQNMIGTSKDEHRDFITHEWQFLEPQKHSLAWGPEDKVFPFDLVIPGDNPETVVTALSKVRYALHAVLERTSFHVNLAASADVLVKRGPMPGAPWALALMESIEATGDWAQQLDYRVSVPTRSLKDGELFHTRFELVPRSKGMKLMAVGVLIKEYVRYYGPRGEALHRFARVVVRNENFISPSGACTTTPRKADECLDLVDATSIQIPLAIPAAYTGIQYDVQLEQIEIRHRIKFLIKIRDASMLIHSVFIAVPVTIMPVTARDDSNILPQYEAALRNPGTILMRSNTLPPAYDALHPTPRGQNVAADQEQPGDTHSDASSDVPPLSLVEPGTEVNGFPAPLRRSRSQFYLASPDSTPPMRPVDSTTILVDMPESSNMASRGSNQRSCLSAMMADPDQHFDTLPLPLPPFLYGQNGRTQSNAQDTQSDCEHSLCRTESRASTTSSRRLSSLGDRLNSITDKMRSIFHGRSSASGDIRRYSNASCIDVGCHNPDVVPSLDSSEMYSAMPVPRRSSVAVPAVLAPPASHRVPSRHRATNSMSAFNGLHFLNAAAVGLADPNLDGVIKPPPNALLHRVHNNPPTHALPPSPLAANQTVSPSPVNFR